MSHQSQSPITHRARRALGFIGLVLGGALFYIIGISIWELVADPTPWMVVAAFIATAVAGNRLSRHYGLI